MAETFFRHFVDAVGEAADHALSLWGGGKTQVRQWQKSSGEPVCEADLEIDALLKETLSDLAPDAGWLSEETVDNAERLACERIWVVDPIDGTKDFLGGRPGWAVSVALVEHGQPIMAVLAAPARNELWIASVGGGARRNGARIESSARRSLAGARVPADRLLPEDSDLVRVEKPNSIALRMAMVAADDADLLATARWGNEWDIAASTLIAREAGACVTDALGRRLVFNRARPTALGILCCAPQIHDAAVSRFSDRARAVLGPERH